MRLISRPLRWGLVGLWLAACTAGALLQPPRPVPALRAAEPFSAADLLYPIERNPHLRLPLVRSGLRSLLLRDDGLHGWAVGAGGLVIATQDGGSTWVEQATPTHANLRAIAFAADGRQGLAVGDDGEFAGEPTSPVIATADGGASWRLLPPAPAGRLTWIALAADGRHGWALGEYVSGLPEEHHCCAPLPPAGLLTTVDGGRSWVAQSKIYLNDLWLAADGQHAWGVGLGGVSATQDAGKTWADQQDMIGVELSSVYFQADRLHGWAAGEARLLTTADGGGHWAVQCLVALTPLPLPAAHPQRQMWVACAEGAQKPASSRVKEWSDAGLLTPARLRSVRFAADGRHGFVTGEEGTLLATADAGASWVPLALNGDLEALQLNPDGRRAWLISSGRTVLASTDGGATWSAQTRPAPMLTGVCFAGGGERGWAVGTGGTVLATADGGRTWLAQSPPGGAGLLAVHCAADGQHVWAVGQDRTVIATGDGGRHWRAAESFVDASTRQAYVPHSEAIYPAPEDLTAVDFAADNLRGWAVGKEGLALYTLDGGRQWWVTRTGHVWSDRQGSHLAPQDLQAIHFAADGQHGWAVGWAEEILATVDGGRTWVEQLHDFRLPLHTVYFTADGQRGWVAGEGVGATRDGGRTWTLQSIPVDKTVLMAIAFAPDGQHGAAVGSAGTVIATADGGNTWSLRQSPAQEDLNSVFFSSDGRQAWAVGRAGTLITSGDGGSTWREAEAPYRRLPAPWFWLAVLPAFAMLAWGGRTGRPTAAV
jgi:photosystem II stability/assembly factor-like uncharacterized protein